VAIALKIAKSDREVDDALWVRHEVLVVEDGRFGGQALPGERLIDRYDTLPGVVNLIAYEDGDPIGTMRVTRDGDLGVPAEAHYDFSAYRQAAFEELLERQQSFSTVLAQPVVHMANAGMLAVRQRWRSRRDVIRAMFKMATGVAFTWEATHWIITVNYETARMYKRLGFKTLADKFWVEEIGNYVIPLAARAESVFDWAFGDLPHTPFDTFKDSFERLFLKPGEVIFREGEFGHSAYIIDTGRVSISRMSAAGSELALAVLERGDLFGEIALIDEGQRSATAVALTDVELMTLEHNKFMSTLMERPSRVSDILEIFTTRIRKMDELAIVLAYAPAGQRLEFALNLMKERAKPDRSESGERIVPGGPLDLARSAGVDEDETRRFLEELRGKGRVEFSEKQIRFLH